MPQHLAMISLLVSDYDEAIDYYRNKLQFVLLEDTPLGEGKRWVRMAPPGSEAPQILLARAVNPRQTARVGDQSGGRVFLFLHTDDFWRDYRAMQQAGVRFVRQPQEETYGTVAVFEDLYGNRWDLLEPK